MKHPKKILVTGATGYVGGRLIPLLLASGYPVKAMGRSLEKMKARSWSRHPKLELVRGDVMDPEGLKVALSGCYAAYYLVHSMVSQKNRFESADRQAARNMVRAAAEAGLDRIIYLSGLGDTTQGPLSRHLRSRHEVARILQSGTVPTTVLRAAMILGSGSASFELLRYLVDRMPIMTTPKWVDTLSQPIAIRNVLYYLKGCLTHDETRGETYDIGGPDVISYRELMDIYAEEAHISKRFIFRVSFLTPLMSAYWLQFIAPLPSPIVLALTEGLRNPVICKDHRIEKIIPQRLLSCRETIHLALERLKQEKVETRWSDAGALLVPEWVQCGDPDYAGGTILECCYRVRLQATAQDVWQPIQKIGGETGWYYGNSLWQIRGLWDRLIGGIGLRKGRRHPCELSVGDSLDFWRVIDVDAPYRLLLLAEMKLPGEALMEFRTIPVAQNVTELQAITRFLPRGLWGILYWYSLLPFRQLIFGGMLKAIAGVGQKPVLTGPESFEYKNRNQCRLPTL